MKKKAVSVGVSIAMLTNTVQATTVQVFANEDNVLESSKNDALKKDKSVDFTEKEDYIKTDLKNKNVNQHSDYECIDDCSDHVDEDDILREVIFQVKDEIFGTEYGIINN